MPGIVLGAAKRVAAVSFFKEFKSLERKILIGNYNSVISASRSREFYEST